MSIFSWPPCEDPELTRAQRAGDAALSLLAAFAQLAVLLATLPVWGPLALLVVGFVALSETKAGGRAMGKIGAALAACQAFFKIPGDPLWTARAATALDHKDAEALARALAARGFLGSQCVRPAQRALLLKAAVEGEAWTCADALVQAGCRVGGFRAGFDALRWAVERREPAAARWAIDRGAKPRVAFPDWGWSDLGEAVKLDDVEMVELLVRARPPGEGARRAALRLAAENGKPASLGWMLAREDWRLAASRELFCRRRPTLLMLGSCCRACVALLLPLSRPSQASYLRWPSMGRLFPGMLWFRENAGAGALDVEKREHALDFLRDAGVDLTRRGWRGGTLLHKAAQRETVDALAWLLADGHDPKAVNDSGETPLMWALGALKAEAFDVLVGVSDLNAVDKKGRGALHCLAKNPASHDEEGRARMVGMAKELLARGVDPEARDKKGLRAVDLAARRANAPLFELLSAHGEWSHEAVREALRSSEVKKMKRPEEVAAIEAIAARACEAEQIGAAAPVRVQAAPSMRL